MHISSGSQWRPPLSRNVTLHWWKWFYRTFSPIPPQRKFKICFCFGFFCKNTLWRSVRHWGKALHVYRGGAAAPEQWLKTLGVSLGVGGVNLFALEHEPVILCLTPRCSQWVEMCHTFPNCVNMPFRQTFIHLCWGVLLELRVVDLLGLMGLEK